MRARSILPPAAHRLVEDLGAIDIMIGIPSYNNARTIGHVVEATHAGLAKYFPRMRTLIVNSDGRSTDGTQQVVTGLHMPPAEVLLIAHPLFPVHRLTIPYTASPGRAARSGACSTWRAWSARPRRGGELRSPEHQSRVDPAASGADPGAGLRLRGSLLLPPQVRWDHPNNIVYPLTRALYRQRVRQPIGGDFGLSGRLAAHYLLQDVWDTDVARPSIDIWMTTTAICDGFKSSARRTSGRSCTTRRTRARISATCSFRSSARCSP